MSHEGKSPNPDFVDPSDLPSRATPQRTSSEDAPDDPPKVGVLEQPGGEETNVPGPMVQEGAPD